MRLVVVTPVGPGHQSYAEKAIESVHVARRNKVGFSMVRHVVIDDTAGKLGRSKARNLGMADDADWYFFLDADDRMRGDAIELNDFSAPATFGALSLSGKLFPRNVFPCGWREVATHGARGTLSMGFFVKATVARALRFNEDLDAGEDFDFYMRLPGFTKIEKPLVDIGYDLPSANGPRGYDIIDWTGICNKVIFEAVARDRQKYDVRCDAVLAKAGYPRSQLGRVPQPLSA